MRTSSASRLDSSPRAERNQEERGVERHEDRDRNQEAEQQLACRAGIFEALARELGVRPQETANIGGEPESVDTEREHQQHGAVGEQPPKGRGSPRKRTTPPAGATAPICAAGTVASKVVMRWLPGGAAVIVLQLTATDRKGASSRTDNANRGPTTMGFVSGDDGMDVSPAGSARRLKEVPPAAGRT